MEINPSQMIYEPETGLSDSELIKVTRHQSTGFETCWQGKGCAGNLAYRHLHLLEGLDIWRFNHKLCRKIHITSQGNPPSFAFRFCLTGEVQGYFSGVRRKFVMKAGQQDLLYAEETKNVSVLQADIPLDMVGVFVSRECLSTWLGDEGGQVSAKILSLIETRGPEFPYYNRKTTRAVESILHRMGQCPYSGMTRKLYFQSCAIELICLQLGSIDQENSRGRPGHARTLHTSDWAGIKRIRERIDDCPGDVPSLTELAKEAGMSQSKFSRLFRDTYGVTVFAYLRDARLDLASQMLSQGKSVTETAFDVGYENLSHFSKVFKMRFGILPSQFAR